VNSQAGRLRYVKTSIADFHVTLIELLVVIAYHCHPGGHAVAGTITMKIGMRTISYLTPKQAGGAAK